MKRALLVSIFMLTGFFSQPSHGTVQQSTQIRQTPAVQWKPATQQKLAPSGIYYANIVSVTKSNRAFRRVLSTAQRMQIVTMSIPPGGDIGEEVHQRVEQIIFIVDGNGKVSIDGVESPLRPGDVVFLTPGIRHNFINTGKTPLALYTIYSPPNHIPGRIHSTKANAEADVENEAFGRKVE